MKKKILFQFVFILLVVGSCKENDEFTVSGIITSQGKPVENVSVLIDGFVNWSATTDANGKFAISDVTPGSHLLTASKPNSNDSFQERHVSISVNNDINLNELSLPKSTTIIAAGEPSVESTKIAWNKTDATDFREYKLYRHTTPGLDETTGTLIYTTVAASDTTFTDNGLISSQNYYYRVYIMNDLGRLGGSNIITLKTKAGNLIPNGDFEIDSDPSAHWTIQRGVDGTYFSAIIDSVKKNGIRSFYNHNDLAYTNGNRNTYSLIKTVRSIELAKNKTYKLSTWLRAKGQRGDVGDVRIHVFDGPNYYATLYPNTENYTDTGWVYYSTNFSVINTVSAFIQIYIPRQHLNLDDLSLIPLH